jgi:plastocyanin
MQGWGTYAAQDGCFQRVRYTGGVVHLPRRIQAHENGIRIDFTDPVDPQIALDPKQAVVLAWNYRYGPQYGSPEFLVSQPQTTGHEVWPVSRVHALDGGKSLFLEIPDIQRANQIQVRLKPWMEEDLVNLFLTVHELRPEETVLPGYQPRKRNLLAHPILRDIRLIGKMADNPWKQRKPQARPVLVKAGPNLSFSPNFLKGHPGETIALTFENPDAVPHNWALIPPGSLQGFGDLINKQIADPDAFARQYIPEKGGTIAYTDVVQPGMKATIYFTLPQKSGRYPFVCTFPGHWMVMNGVLSVDP